MGWRIIIPVCALAACLVGLEVGLRVLDILRGREFAGEPEIRPYRIFGFDPYSTSSGDIVIRSRHGEIFPIRKPEGTTRIVTFGGSTTVNKAVYSEKGIHYSLVLQERLNARFPERNFEVITVANEAYATTHSITLLAFDVLSWDPDIVILSHNFNDLTSSYFPGFVPDYSNKYSHPYYSMTWGRYTCKSSRLCREVSARLRALGVLGHDVRRSSHGPEPLASAQDVFARNLESFVLLAKSRCIVPVLGSQPMEHVSENDFNSDMASKPYNDIVLYPLHEEFTLHHQRFNEIIKETAARTGTVFVDNNRTFGGEARYFKDFIHHSTEGVELLAEDYEKAIVSLLDTKGRLPGNMAVPGSAGAATASDVARGGCSRHGSAGVQRHSVNSQAELPPFR